MHITGCMFDPLHVLTAPAAPPLLLSPDHAAGAVTVRETIADQPPAHAAQHDVDHVFQEDVSHVLGAPAARLQGHKAHLHKEHERASCGWRRRARVCEVLAHGRLRASGSIQSCTSSFRAS